MWIQLAALAVSVLSSASEGQDEANQLARQAALTDFTADNDLQAAVEQSDKIMTASVSVKAQQVAQMSASGFIVGDGSSRAVIEETEKLARMDAMATLYSGVRQAAATRAGASSQRSAASNAVLTGQMRGVSNGISQYAAFKSEGSL